MTKEEAVSNNISFEQSLFFTLLRVQFCHFEIQLFSLLLGGQGADNRKWDFQVYLINSD